MNWRRLRLVLLAVLLVVGGAGAFYLSTVIRQHADGMTRYVRVDVWAVQQAEYELQQFRAIFARHVAGDPGAGPAAVRDSFVRARSAIPLLERSPDYQEFRLLADVDTTARRAKAALDDVADAFGGRTDFRGDLRMLRRVEALLEQPIFKLRRLAFDLAHIRLELQDGDLANVRWLAGVNRWMLIGFIAVVLVIIAFLLHEARAAKRAESEASDARRRLFEAIESVEEGFALYDRDDRILLSNSRFRHFLLGDEAAVAIGLSFAEAMRACAEAGRVPAAEGRVEDWLAECLAHHDDAAGIFEMALDDGTHLLVGKRQTFDGGRVAIYTDVTELKHREEKLREALQQVEVADRSKTEFLANMNHELRTPLNAIMGFSEMFKIEALGPLGTPEYREHAGDIHDSAQHLLEIITDILDASKIVAGRHELNDVELDVRAVIESGLRLVRERAERAGHAIAVELPDALPPLLADGRAVKQILVNLLSNAVKFTPESGRITVAAGRDEDGGLAISIADTGIGIAAEDIPRVLTFFGQADSGHARKFEGSGLGLPLARSLIELHDGTLALASEPGRGTTVTLRFPAKRVAGAPRPLRAAG